MYLSSLFWELELDMLSQFPFLLGQLPKFFVEDHKPENSETNPESGIEHMITVLLDACRIHDH